ncbi:MAG TPA: hypothetical protein VGC21_22920 [Telluria sp.]|jgi:hypothetical protein
MQPNKLLRSNSPYLIIVLSLLLVFIALGLGKPVRVGDGSEYYGMFYAWDLTHRPWMNAASYAAYEKLHATNTILGLVTREQLANAFQALRVGETSDFNHFWFFSLLAVICSKLLAVIGIKLTIHQSFLAVHFVLLAMTGSIAYRYFSWKGVLAIGLMLLASPMFWFIDKVHTEFMTVCLVLSAIMLLRAERYTASAMLIALASTQNPSFALVACIPLFYRVVLQRERAYSLFEVAMLVTTVLGVLMHPAYYFMRYGVPTPQLLAGGAALGANLSTFYVWIVDPDVGLLPNWPLGLGVLVLALLSLAQRRGAPLKTVPVRWTAFFLLYLAINFYAHSSTTNLNSGATPGLARYALWYLPLMFPVFLYVLDLFTPRSRAFYGALLVLVAVCAVSLKINDPRRYEQYSNPSLSSRFLQTRLPGLYNPPVEIYVERFSGIGEEVHQRPLRALVGPDCGKVLVMAGADKRDALAAPGCMFDPVKLNAYVNSPQFALDTGGLPAQPAYRRMPDSAAAALLLTVPKGEHRVGSDGPRASILGDGWSVPEPWGIWSQQKSASLVIPCNQAQYFHGAPQFTLTLQLRPFQQQKIQVTTASGVVWEGAINQTDQRVAVPLKPADCRRGRALVTLELPNAVSPMQLGMSGDARMLAVGLSAYEITVP